MSSAGEKRQHFCESSGEEEDGDNADVDEDDEDDEEVDMAIRDEIKRRAERLLNVHQKVAEVERMRRLCGLAEARVHKSRNYFLFHFSRGKSPKSIIARRKAICPWIAFLRRQVA